MTPADIEGALRTFLVKELGVPDGVLARDTPLLDGGLIDSLGVVSLVAFCEDELECVVPAEEISPEAFESLGTLTDAVGQWRRG